MSTPDYITPNQLANMLDKRAKDLAEILERVANVLEDTEDHLAATLSLDEALASIEEAARCLRGNPSPGYMDGKSEAQRAADAHQPGIPPGGGQPDLFSACCGSPRNLDTSARPWS